MNEQDCQEMVRNSYMGIIYVMVLNAKFDLVKTGFIRAGCLSGSQEVFIGS